MEAKKSKPLVSMAKFKSLRLRGGNLVTQALSATRVREPPARIAKPHLMTPPEHAAAARVATAEIARSATPHETARELEEFAAYAKRRNAQFAIVSIARQTSSTQSARNRTERSCI